MTSRLAKIDSVKQLKFSSTATGNKNILNLFGNIFDVNLAKLRIDVNYNTESNLYLCSIFILFSSN